MRRVSLVLLTAAVLVPTSGSAAIAVVNPPPVRLLTPIGRGTAYSLNWSGYAAFKSGTTFSDVKGSWTQPTATCNTSKATYASFWVGIDGYKSNSVEQTGTDSDCTAANVPKYYAWYEMYPNAPVNLSSTAYPVQPSDAMSAEVSVSGSNFTLTIKNTTRGWSYSKTLSLSNAAKASAEWVAEAPSRCSVGSCTVLPLTNFGTVNFSGSYATGNNHTGSISDSAWSNDKVVMVTRSLFVKAMPSTLSSSGTAFSVQWMHA